MPCVFCVGFLMGSPLDVSLQKKKHQEMNIDEMKAVFIFSSLSCFFIGRSEREKTRLV